MRPSDDPVSWWFQSTLPTRGATLPSCEISRAWRVSIHAPHTGSDFAGEISDHCIHPVSIHAPHTGSDSVNSRDSASADSFQSTLPTRGATGYPDILSPLGSVSIHAPHTGSDIPGVFEISTRPGFNPRSPHGERPNDALVVPSCLVFQSTLPTRGATSSPFSNAACKFCFNPRSPHGERHLRRYKLEGHFIVSIHAPHTGSDGRHRIITFIKRSFNPRSPHGERPGPLRPPRRPCRFNPRSPHGERPGASADLPTPKMGFNPRSPHGERLHISTIYDLTYRFQSTLPTRGATRLWELIQRAGLVSIHAPHTGSDGTTPPGTTPPASFNPRSPHGERLIEISIMWCIRRFNPRSPHGERLSLDNDLTIIEDVSIHAPHTGSDISSKSYS